jgi:prepilin-type N-terminal cleavage/methylation domain-containing protein
MTARRGFTVVELLVVIVVAALVLGALVRTLSLNQQTSTIQNERIRSTQAMRGALEVLSAELREISPAGGDLVTMDDDALAIRAMRSLAIICEDRPRGSTAWRAIMPGTPVASGDSVFVFADNDGETGTDDAWIATRLTSVAAGATCAGMPAWNLGFAAGGPFTADSVSSGAQVRSFDRLEYGLMAYAGRHYLGRRSPGEDWTPIVGPLSSRGLRFAYLDADGSVTTTPTRVRQIRVVVRTESPVRTGDGRQLEDSMSVRVHTRN